MPPSKLFEFLMLAALALPFVPTPLWRYPLEIRVILAEGLSKARWFVSATTVPARF